MSPLCEFDRFDGTISPSAADERYTGSNEIPTARKASRGKTRAESPHCGKSVSETAPSFSRTRFSSESAQVLQRMTNSQRLATVRAHLRRWLRQNVTSHRVTETQTISAPQEAGETPTADGKSETGERETLQLHDPDSPNSRSPNPETEQESDRILSESILIVDGFYAGRTFETAHHRATWFMEPDELKIHGPDQSVVASFRADDIIDDAASESEKDSDSRPSSIPFSPNKAPAADASESERHGGKPGEHGDDAMPKAA